jgi:hypothetical protein
MNYSDYEKVIKKLFDRISKENNGLFAPGDRKRLAGSIMKAASLNNDVL